MKQFIHFLTIIMFLFLVSCQSEKPASKTDEQWQKEIQQALITAQPGDTVWLPEATVYLTASLSFHGIDNVVIKGKGIDKSILSFKNQTEGAEGIKVTANNVTLEDFTVQDMDGDGIKIQSSKGVTLRRIKAEWTAGADTANGGYGLYPVDCDNLLIEHCQLFGASDAGIYAGQSRNIIIRNNYASGNVQGIAIENCINVDVYNNHSEGNTVGISVYNLPELPIIQRGHSIRVHLNKINDNNHWNFGAEGAIVGTVPAGTGTFVLAGENVEIFENEISGHLTVGTGIISYQITGRPMNDSLYNPFTHTISVHNNSYHRLDASRPDTTKELGNLLAGIFGKNVPDILFDGIFDPELLNPDQFPPSDKWICIKDNGNATFANLSVPTGFTEISTELEVHDCTHEPVMKVLF